MQTRYDDLVRHPFDDEGFISSHGIQPVRETT